MKKLRTDISDKAHSIGHLFEAHRDELLSCKSSSDAFALVQTLFAEGNYKSPKAKEILFKLQRGMSPSNTLIYLQNIIFSSKGMATY